jgi:hypothetical protein
LEEVLQKEINFCFMELVKRGFGQNGKRAGGSEMEDHGIVGASSFCSLEKTFLWRERGGPLVLTPKKGENEKGEKKPQFFHFLFSIQRKGLEELNASFRWR